MSKLIEKLKISGLFDKKEVEWDLDEVSVLVGKNGSGKTTILHTILNLITQKKTKECFRTNSASMHMSGGGKLSYQSTNLKIGNDTISLILRSLENQTGKIGSDIKRALNAIQSLEEKEGSPAKNEMIIEQFSSSEELKGKSISVEYISTVNLNANAKNKIEKGNGEEITALDWEIESEIGRMKSVMDKSPKETSSPFSNFLTEINNLYKESNKEVDYIKEKNELLIHWIDSKEKINIKTLSSGERQLLYILLKSFNSSLLNPVILMDEPEISLHLSWQEKLISSMRKINKNCQIIIVTHSPAIVMDGWISALKDIDDIKKPTKRTAKKTIKTQ